MAAIHGVSRLFLVAKRVVQFGVPISVGVWFLLYVLLGGVGLPELMILVGAPLMIGATFWLVAWIVEDLAVSHERRQH
jgi:hypothetical protein